MTRHNVWTGAAAAVLWGVSQQASAGALQISGPDVSWEPVASTPVPTLSTWALIMMSILLAIIAVRTWREAPNVLRSVLVVAAAGLSSSSLLWSDDAKSGFATDILTGSGCEGSITVTDGFHRLENNCGQTVVLTVGSCDEGEVLGHDASPSWAETGDLLEDGLMIALPYCGPPVR